MPRRLRPLPLAQAEGAPPVFAAGPSGRGCPLHPLDKGHGDQVEKLPGEHFLLAPASGTLCPLPPHERVVTQDPSCSELQPALAMQPPGQQTSNKLTNKGPVTHLHRELKPPPCRLLCFLFDFVSLSSFTCTVFRNPNNKLLIFGVRPKLSLLTKPKSLYLGACLKASGDLPSDLLAVGAEQVFPQHPMGQAVGNLNSGPLVTDPQNVRSSSPEGSKLWALKSLSF